MGLILNNIASYTNGDEMSKLKFIIEKSPVSLTEAQAQILFDLYGSGYSSYTGVDVDYLVEHGLLFKSKDLVILSDIGDQLIDDAALEYISVNKPEKLERKSTRKARGISPELESLAEQAKEIVESKFEVKEMVTYCSNFHIKLKKRTLGIRQFELTNANKFRVFGYNMDDSIAKKLESLGAVVKKGGSNIYLDFDLSKEIIETVINSLV